MRGMSFTRRKRVAALVWAPVFVAGLALVAGCSGGRASYSAANVRVAWALKIDWAGTEITYPLDQLDIYLVAPEVDDQYPETFELRGDGVLLVGEFPMDVRVGYAEEFDHLVGRTITLATRGGDPHARKSPYLRVSGSEVPVQGGSIRFEKVAGQWVGSEGDKTLQGTVELHVGGGVERQTVRGAFSVRAVTWG